MGVLRKLREFFSVKQHTSEPQNNNTQIDYLKLSRVLGYAIRSPQLFREALLHRSYLQMSVETSLTSNERLEFLGDAILNLIITEFVYEDYPEAEEGELTDLRSRLVNRKALALYARIINLWDFMLLSAGAALSVGKGSDTILSDAYEAVIGAIYLDGGYEEAKKFVRRQIQSLPESESLLTRDGNFKSRLLEYAQAQGMLAPRYIVVSENGPDHDRTYTIQVKLADQPLGTGVGKNKKDAEQAAAEQTLIQLGLFH